MLVMGSNGSAITQLTAGAWRDVHPVWLDDATIVFSRTPAG